MNPDKTPSLYLFCSDPAARMTAVARLLAQRTGACLLSTGFVRNSLHGAADDNDCLPVYTIARDNLVEGISVIADGIYPALPICEAWRRVGETCQARIVWIEEAHTGTAQCPQGQPAGDDRSLIPRAASHITIDTTTTTPADAVDIIVRGKLLMRAIAIATQAHKGQTDRSGKPYITHPLRVMEACETTAQKIVAVLHDVVEDTAVTLEELAAEFPPAIVEAVDFMTHRPEVTYEQYIARLASNAIARAVKLRDLTDNMDLRRLVAITDDDVTRCRKYLKAFRFLSGQS